jgi:RNA polymerase sigma factor (TIGR02999 family)
VETDANITLLLERWSDGDREALDAVTRLVYEHLHQLAGKYMRSENAGHTLSPTAVVHEAYLRLSGSGLTLQNRGHFLAIAAREMRRVLVEHARKRGAQKRGGGDWLRVTLHEGRASEEGDAVDIIAVQDALEKLRAVDPRKADLVDLIAFAGLTTVEVAETLQVSLSTVNRDWRMARAFLQNELKSNAS